MVYELENAPRDNDFSKMGDIASREPTDIATSFIIETIPKTTEFVRNKLKKHNS